MEGLSLVQGLTDEAIVSLAGVTFQDDVLLNLGTNSDASIVLRSTALAADAELTNVIVGTSDHPGVAANSLIISNETADGDIMFAVQSGGNTTMSMLLDASAADLILQGLTTLNFPTASTISTTAGNLTLTPGTDVAISSGRLFIGDTANANQGVGLTINQGTDDKQGFSLKSSDVDTGLTTIVKGGFDVEVDDYFAIGKGSPNTGGVYMYVLAEHTEANPFFLEVWGGAPGTSDTTSNAYSPINFFVGQHDGSNGDVDMGANSNLMVWGEIDSSSARVSRMVLKADDGELHLGNTTLVAFDEEDDIQLVRAMQKEGSSGGILESERDNPFYDYNKLYELGLAGEKDKDGDFLFPLQSRLHAHEGAMWQTHLRVAELEEKLALAESKLAAIGA
jgi:hypothetical protein